jgi:hypothetical protein
MRAFLIALLAPAVAAAALYVLQVVIAVLIGRLEQR